VGVGPELWEAAGIPGTLTAPLAVALPLGAVVEEPEGVAVAVPERAGVPDTLCVTDAEVEDDGCRVVVLLADCKECKGDGASAPARMVRFGFRGRRGLWRPTAPRSHNTARANFPHPTSEPVEASTHRSGRGGV
jgi:hypothetical protein